MKRLLLLGIVSLVLLGGIFYMAQRASREAGYSTQERYPLGSHKTIVWNGPTSSSTGISTTYSIYLYPEDPNALRGSWFIGRVENKTSLDWEVGKVSYCGMDGCEADTIPPGKYHVEVEQEESAGPSRTKLSPFVVE